MTDYCMILYIHDKTATTKDRAKNHFQGIVRHTLVEPVIKETELKMKQPTKEKNKNIPSGLVPKELLISPRTMEVKLVVIPHVAQGNPTILLNLHSKEERSIPHSCNIGSNNDNKNTAIIPAKNIIFKTLTSFTSISTSHSP